jgi:TonB-dependent receptor
MLGSRRCVVSPIWPAALITLLIAGDAAAQQTGSIRGRVVDHTPAPVTSASVQLAGTNQFTTTNADGRFALANLAPGSYRVVVTYLGLRADTMTVDVRAGSVAEVTVPMETAAIALAGLEITGQRRGQARALNQQRTAASIQNVIAREQIERFPDANIADGLKRIPGVTVSQDYGEAQGVMVRGLSAGLNSVMVNGERVPSNTIGGRAVNLGGILSDMVGAIEIYKALTPDLDADAIGGSINLITKRPQDGETIFNGAVATGYNEFREKPQTDVDLTYGRRVGELGVLFGGSYLNSYRSEQSLHYAWDGDLLRDFTFYNYELERERYGLNGTLEYDISDLSRVYLRAMYNRFDDRQYTPKFTRQLGRGTNLTTSSVANAPTIRTARQRNHALTTVTLAGGGSHELGSAKVDYSASYARGGNDQPVYFNASWQTLADYTFDLSDRTYPVVSAANGTQPDQLSNYRLQSFSIETEETGDRDFTGGLNLELPLTAGGVSGALKFGAKVRAKETFRIAQEMGYRPASGVVITMDQHVRRGFGNPEFYGDRYDFGGGYDPGSLKRFFQQNPAMFSGAANVESPIDEYDAGETVSAGYGMLTANLGRLTAVAGTRYEHTSLSYDGNRIQFDSAGDYVDTTPVNQQQSYGGLYPSLHLKYQLAENTNLRGAISRSLARPSYSSLAPYELILHEDNEIERGNPALKPYNAVNFDVLAERYLSSIGVIAAGVFYKDLGNVIISRTFAQQGGPYDGWRVSQPQNGTGAYVYGVELTWQQPLTFLRGALGGLGLYTNYTYTKSRMDIDGDREISVPGQIPHAANVALLYEKYGLSGSLSMNHQARFIDDVGSTEDEDEYFHSRTQFDLSLSQQVRHRVRVFAEVNNITNEPYRFYVGPGGLGQIPLQNAIYGRWGTLGLRYDF